MTDMTASTLNPAAKQALADAVGLKGKLRRATGRARRQAMLLTAPLFLFLLVTFLMPIGEMLLRSVQDPLVGEAMPRTVEALEDWDAGAEPVPDPAYVALLADLTALRDGGSGGRELMGRVATRLNFETPGMRSMVTRAARAPVTDDPAEARATLIKADRDWEKVEKWATIQRLGSGLVPVHYLASVDARMDVDGSVVWQDEERQIYLKLWWRTIWVSMLVTGLTVVLGYPVAYLLATLPMRYANVLLIFVLLPFWTSLLVRTTSWIVVLGTNGVLLDTLVWLGLVADDSRPQLIYNMTGTIVAMTHILLPFMILPLYSVMKGISPSYMRAATSLGAPPWLAFLKVYVPQTVPGLGAGGILVFILAIGYYITPALVGGEDGTLISNFIAFHMQRSLNWGLAAALGAMLLVGVLALYWLYDKIVGVDNMRLG